MPARLSLAFGIFELECSMALVRPKTIDPAVLFRTVFTQQWSDAWLSWSS